MRPFAFLVFLALSASACDRAPAPQDYAARLGSESLPLSELEVALSGLDAEVDSADAAGQLIEQWVTNQLLLAEARRRGIDREPEVRAQADAAERAVLVDALLSQLYEEDDAGPTEAELADFFERNRERLRLIEPYVRLRYIVTSDLAAARDARARLAQLDSTDQAEWETLVDEVSSEPDLSRTLAASLIPETRAFAEYPAVAQSVAATREGRTGPVIIDRGLYHVAQIMERVPAGTLPRRPWIEASLRQQLQIEGRKLLYARLVERLRNEALAREQLHIR